jgi:cystine transport system substrate-binding protein
MLRLNSFAAVVLAAALALAGCGGSDEDAGGSAGSGGSSGSGEALKIGTEGTYAPFTFHDPKNNALTGYDIEVANAVAAKLGRKVEYSETTFDAIFAGLDSKRYDVVANQISINPEREAKYTFSKPYTASTGVVVTRADDTSVTKLADISGKKSAQSSTSNWAETATGAGAEIEAVEGLTQAIALLRQGRVDVTVNDSLAILDYLKSSGDKEVKIAAETGDRTEQAFAFRKGDPLAAEFDTALEALTADGTLAKISSKWFGEDVSGTSGA